MKFKEPRVLNSTIPPEKKAEIVKYFRTNNDNTMETMAIIFKLPAYKIDKIINDDHREAMRNKSKYDDLD